MDAQALGRLLREAREAREISLADAERALRIRQRILIAFEDGVFDLPDSSAVQLRGLLGNYARYLGLDDAGILEQLEQLRHGTRRRQRRERGRRRPRHTPRQPQPVPQLDFGGGESLQLRRRRRRSFFSAVLVLVVGVGALAVIGLVALQFLAEPEEIFMVDGEVPRLVPPTSLPTTVARQDAVPAPGSNPARRERQITQIWNGSGVLVTIEAAQRTWLRLAADGEEEFVGMLRPGEHVEVAARTEVALTAGNAEALLITWNGQEQEVPGLRGQLVEMAFTQTSITLEAGVGFEPTPEFTATPRPTSLVDVGALLGTLFPETTPGAPPGSLFLPAATTPPPAVTDIPPAESETGTPSVTATATESATPTATPTNTPTATPVDTPTPTISPTATAVLPPRVTIAPLTPAKSLQNG